MTTTDGPLQAHELDAPDTKLSVREIFGLDTDMIVPGFSVSSDYVPDIDDAYVFDHEMVPDEFVFIAPSIEYEPPVLNAPPILG